MNESLKRILRMIDSEPLQCCQEQIPIKSIQKLSESLNFGHLYSRLMHLFQFY
jgi:hypothetical protein